MIKTLARSLREYKKGSALTIFLSILEAAFEILIPLCMADRIFLGISHEELIAERGTYYQLYTGAFELE